MAVRISRRAARSSRSLLRLTVTSTSGTATPASRPTMRSVTTSSISVKPPPRDALTARPSLLHLQLVLDAGGGFERPSAGADRRGDGELHRDRGRLGHRLEGHLHDRRVPARPRGAAAVDADEDAAARRIDLVVEHGARLALAEER